MAQKHSYDVRNILGENTETAKFWISSFGKECYEVMWLRFRTAFLAQYGNAAEKYLLKIRPLLIDFRGIVTIEALVDVIKQYGNFSETLARGRLTAVPGGTGASGGAGTIPSGSASAKVPGLTRGSSKKNLTKNMRPAGVVFPYLEPERSFKKATSRDSLDPPVVVLDSAAGNHINANKGNNVVGNGSSKSPSFTLSEKVKSMHMQYPSFSSVDEMGEYCTEGFEEAEGTAEDQQAIVVPSPQHNAKAGRSTKKSKK